jgi:putative salt-induced outer membrane protein YdiY
VQRCDGAFTRAAVRDEGVLLKSDGKLRVQFGSSELTRDCLLCICDARFYQPTNLIIIVLTVNSTQPLFTRLTGKLFALCAVSTLALGGEASPKATKSVSPTPVESPWEVTAATGVGFASGNSDNLNLSAQLLASYLEGPNELYLGADYFYAESLGIQTMNNLRVFGTYNRLLTDRLYLGAAAEYFTDDSADLDYRISALPYLGVYLLKSDRVKLAIEAGGGYLWENQGTKDDYFALRFGQRLEMRLSDRVTLWESVSFVPQATDFDNHYLIAEAGLKTRLSDRWALRTFVRNTYDATPSAGREENDLSLIAGVSYSLGGLPPEDAAPVRRSLKPAKAAPVAPAMGWTRTAALGFALAQGNSETLLATADFLAEYRGADNEIFLGASGAYGESEGVQNVENARGAAQYNRLFSDHWYGAVATRFLYDSIAQVDYRISPRAALGYYLLRTDEVQLSLEAGPGYLWENVGGVKSDYLTIEALQKLTWKVNDTVSIGENIGWIGSTEDFNDYLILASAFVDVAVSDRVSFRTAVTNTFDNTPAAGAKRNDFILSAGVAVKF